jgi:hypothetical protein
MDATVTENVPDEWREFLTDRPPGTRGEVDRAAYVLPPGQARGFPSISLPELLLYCDGECKVNSYCRGEVRASGKLFGGIDRVVLARVAVAVEPTQNIPWDAILGYCCEKCGRLIKTYSVRFLSIAPSPEARFPVDVQKISEWPAFSPRTPSKLTTLIGPDRDLFLKGRQAESDGLGIGAFAYYRRIVENQKNRVLDEIIRVARHIGAPADAIAALEAARGETQFGKAVDGVKEAIPRVLYIKGHNPFTLLHGALSEGIHAASDGECLVAANDIRLILVELAERLNEALREQRELDAALSRLVNRRN